MSFIQKLNKGKLDIVGDIHGEYDALLNLLYHLGYNLDGYHPEGRKLVFVGDLCDRGPDSPAVIYLVAHLVKMGNAQVVLGNHELNVLQNKPKDGGGWFFKEREPKDTSYEPFARVTEREREIIFEFLNELPVALENDELRIVHAAWDDESIDFFRNVKGNKIYPIYKGIEDSINKNNKENGILDAYHLQKSLWNEEDLNIKPPFLDDIANYNLSHQMHNPIRIITSGVEEKAPAPFYTSGKWRFVRRYSWWDRYEQNIPVVVGHFWRKWENKENPEVENVFANIEPTSWHGKNNNVFCVDFSVGGRFKERKNNQELGSTTKLAALSWPERTLTLENGEVIATSNFEQKTQRKNKM